MQIRTGCIEDIRLSREFRRVDIEVEAQRIVTGARWVLNQADIVTKVCTRSYTRSCGSPARRLKKQAEKSNIQQGGWFPATSLPNDTPRPLKPGGRHYLMLLAKSSGGLRARPQRGFPVKPAPA